MAQCRAGGTRRPNEDGSVPGWWGAKAELRFELDVGGLQDVSRFPSHLTKPAAGNVLRLKAKLVHLFSNVRCQLA